MPMSDDREPLNQPPSAKIAPPCAGSRETTDAKIRIDMPLPMPRWVISSPSHMTSAVPAVQVIMIERGARRR